MVSKFQFRADADTIGSSHRGLRKLDPHRQHCRPFHILIRMLTPKCMQSTRCLVQFKRFHFVDPTLMTNRVAETSLQKHLNQFPCQCRSDNLSAQ